MQKFIACLLVFSLCFFSQQQASAQILDKIKNKAKQRADQKVDQTIDKGLDEMEGKNKQKEESTKTKENDNDTGDDDKDEKKEKGPKSASLKSYSRYDFVSGDKVVYAEDFAQDVVGEFPTKWNTNGSGEIVTIEGQPGKWLKLIENTDYETPFKGTQHEYYTIEFDLLAEFNTDQTVPWIRVILPQNRTSNNTSVPRVEFILAPNGGINVEESRDGALFESYDPKGYQYLAGKKQLHSHFFDANHHNTPVHISIWVQKERIRAWINQQKVYDLPKGIHPELKVNQLVFETTNYGGPASNYGYYISNIKIAAGAPDTRTKLISGNKWSTTGILFDINSDRIRPTSYGVLKEIASVIKENEGRYRIIGHTDSDGDDAKNLDLSKRRAAAVKTALTKEFDIDDSRLDTEGSGETSPVADNKTPEGKAQNRRVEFVKL